jgi:CubicO group peptidase (beta-lactamase class C family)
MQEPTQQSWAMSRRRFLASAAGGVAGLASLDGPRATRLRDVAAPPLWVPPPQLLHQIPEMLDLADVPGAACAVVNDGRVRVDCFGDAEAESHRRIAPETVFEAASLGKPVFAYAVLRFVERGGLDLDRPLSEYLTVPDADGPRMRRVTARHVLSHTTGLPNWRGTPGPLEPSVDPGRTFSYSGEAYFYLQRVVESLSGVPFERFMRTEVFEPLGMKESSYAWLPEFDGRMAAGYDEKGKRLDVHGLIGPRLADISKQWNKPLEEWRYADAALASGVLFPDKGALPQYITPNAAGSLLTTPRDYARFLARVVAPAPGGLELRPETWRLAITPQVRLNRALSWGLGWGLQQDDAGTLLWQWGANASFQNFVLADPATHRGVAVFTNSQNGSKVYQRIVTGVTGRDQPAFLWLYL